MNQVAQISGTRKLKTGSHLRMRGLGFRVSGFGGCLGLYVFRVYWFRGLGSAGVSRVCGLGGLEGFRA